MSNDNYFPWDDIQDRDELPTGRYRFRINHAEDGVAQSSGKRMFRVGLNVVEPAEFVGLGHFENYVVGSEENPTAIVAGTMGARSFKKLLNACQMPKNNDIAMLMHSLKGCEFVGAMVYKPDADFKNNLTNYYKIGEREVGVEGSGAKASGPAAAPMPQMPQQQMPPQQRQAPQMQPPPVQQQQVQQAPPVQQQVQATQAPPPPLQQQAASVPPQGATIHCMICGEDVPENEFPAHVMRHQQQG